MNSVDSNAMNTGQSHPRIPDFEHPAQMLGLIQHDRLREIIRIMTAGQRLTESDGLPEWVIRAGAECWRGCISFPKSKRAMSENYRLGYMMGFLRRVSPEDVGTEQAVLAVLRSSGVIQAVHAEMERAPLSDAADFYAGFSKALDEPQPFSFGVRAVIHLLLIAGWRGVARLKNTAQVHVWLENLVGPNLTGNRDRVAKLLQKIRFPLTDKGGRPRQKPRTPAPS